MTYRCVGLGTAQRVTEFPAFAAVALAGLHDIPDTIASRAVVIRMRRRAAHERVQPYQLMSPARVTRSGSLLRTAAPFSR